MAITIDDIRAAHQRIAPHIYRSPCSYSLSLSRLCGCNVYCKLDHLQMTGSFKERGARNRLELLSPEERQRGVVAVSAGNHAQGLAWQGSRMGIPVTVVMPVWASLPKVANCRALGAEIFLHGDSMAIARIEAERLRDARNLVFIPPFDDDAIIAGQGTMALEIIEDVPTVDTIVVPVGGGGLIAGIGIALKALRPDAKLVGVEPRNAATLDAALKAGRPVPIQPLPTLGDGLALAQIGDRCFGPIQSTLDELVLVDEAQIATAVLRLMELEKTVVEGSASTVLAALLAQRAYFIGRTVVLVLSGGNIDVTQLGRIIERGLVAEGRLCRLTAAISDLPGSLWKVLQVVAMTGASVRQVEHDRNFAPGDVSQVAITLVLETRDREHITAVIAALARAGVACTAQ